MALLDIWDAAEKLKERLGQATNTFRQNLEAWKQVATQPTLRKEYVETVVKPTVKSAVEKLGQEFKTQQRAKFQPAISAFETAKYLKLPSAAEREANLQRYLAAHPTMEKWTYSALQSPLTKIGVAATMPFLPKKTQEKIRQNYEAIEQLQATEKSQLARWGRAMLFGLPLYSQLGSWLEAPAEAAAAPLLPKAAGIVPSVTRWLGRALIGEAASSGLVYGPTEAIISKKPLTKAIREEIASGIAGRGVGTGIGLGAGLGMAFVGNIKVKPSLKVEDIKAEIEEIKARNIAAAEVAKEIRSRFDSKSLADIAYVKKIIARKPFIEGDIETARKTTHWPIINKVIESIKTAMPERFETDDEAFDFLKRFPSKADTVVKRPPTVEEYKRIAEETLKQLEEVRKRAGTPATNRFEDKGYAEWAKQIRKITISPTEAKRLGLVKVGASDAIKEDVGLLFSPWARSPEYVFEEMGYHKEWEAFLEGEEKMSDFLTRGRNALNRWWEMLGKSKESAHNVFLYLDGRKAENELVPSEIVVAKEIRHVLEVFAEKLNIPEQKRITDYVPHIFKKEFKTGAVSSDHNQLPRQSVQN